MKTTPASPDYKGYRFPSEIISAAKREILPGVEHRQHKGLNNRAENSGCIAKRKLICQNGGKRRKRGQVPRAVAKKRELAP